MQSASSILQTGRFSFLKQSEFRKCCEIAVLYVLFLAALCTITSTADIHASDPPRKHTFKDFIEKYSPVTVWDKIDSERMRGANYTMEEETERFMEAIDPTDELLNLKVKNGDAKILVQKNGRRWMPHTGRFSKIPDDPWNNRFRIVELMKQAIYQARNKMVIMQMLREEHRNHSAYKMGYLVAKTDFATKTLSIFAWRAMRACSMKRQKKLEIDEINYNFLEIMFTQEKQMHLWFEVDLLIELFWQNHLVAKKITNKRKVIDLKKWNDGRFIN